MIGKMRGIRESIHAAGNPACMEVWLDTMKRDFEGMVFVNLVDFDMLYGHRNDVYGYQHALEEFDSALPALLSLLHDDDLLFITDQYYPAITGDSPNDGITIIVVRAN